jgi:transposase-like protein
MHPPPKKEAALLHAAPDQTSNVTITVTQLGLPVKDVALRYSVTPRTVFRWIKQGKVRVVRTPGGHARVLVEASK